MVEILVRDASVLSPDAARLSAVPAGHPMGYRDCFAAFVADVHAAVRRGDSDAGSGADSTAPPDFPTFADASRTAAITDAVLSSARTRTWIEVS